MQECKYAYLHAMNAYFLTTTRIIIKRRNPIYKTQWLYRITNARKQICRKSSHSAQLSTIFDICDV